MELGQDPAQCSSSQPPPGWAAVGQVLFLEPLCSATRCVVSRQHQPPKVSGRERLFKNSFYLHLDTVSLRISKRFSHAFHPRLSGGRGALPTLLSEAVCRLWLLWVSSTPPVEPGLSPGVDCSPEPEIQPAPCRNSSSTGQSELHTQLPWVGCKVPTIKT